MSKSGWVEKLTSSGGFFSSKKTWKKRWFVLKGDCLAYYDDSKDGTSMRNKLELGPSAMVALEKHESVSEDGVVFSVTAKPGAKKTLLKASSPEECRQWIAASQLAIFDHDAKFTEPIQFHSGHVVMTSKYVSQVTKASKLVASCKWTCCKADHCSPKHRPIAEIEEEFPFPYPNALQTNSKADGKTLYCGVDNLVDYKDYYAKIEHSNPEERKRLAQIEANQEITRLKRELKKWLDGRQDKFFVAEENSPELLEDQENGHESDNGCIKVHVGVHNLLTQADCLQYYTVFNKKKFTYPAFMCMSKEDITKALIAHTKDTQKANRDGIKIFKAIQRHRDTSGAIMLSYSWGPKEGDAHPNQEKVKKLRADMQARGYKVWIDLEQMRGDMDEAMKHTVEHSQAIVCCINKSYITPKENGEPTNALKELAFAKEFKLKEELVMLVKMEPDADMFCPVLSDFTKHLFIDLSNEETWDENVTALCSNFERMGIVPVKY